MAYTFKVGGLELLSEIRPLWERLNAMNVDRSLHFGESHRKLTFEARMGPVQGKASGGMARIELAYDGAGRAVGYCLMTIDRDQQAEVDSLYVEAEERDRGLGGELLERTLAWSRAFPVRRTVLMVTVGNEDAPRFYERHGFLPRSTLYELVRE